MQKCRFPSQILHIGHSYRCTSRDAGPLAWCDTVLWKKHIAEHLFQNFLHHKYGNTCYKGNISSQCSGFFLANPPGFGGK